MRETAIHKSMGLTLYLGMKREKIRYSTYAANNSLMNLVLEGEIPRIFDVVFGLTLCPSVPICSNRNDVVSSLLWLPNKSHLPEEFEFSTVERKEKLFQMGLRERGETLLSSLLATQLLQVED
ncbi:hypothetical protein VNO78_34904 [Psophocarpus tetragonolobus]|uniref:Uncharacterized protein n=1 Tax=Psophocarpus tetragonolobus TaxID=3891 RepID=A0AAN9RLH5_PSOTE